MDDKTTRRVAGWCAGLALALGLPGTSAAVTLRLSPNGVDDTAQLPAALETCAGAVTTCRIVLDRGIFRTDLLLVSNFHGQLVGQGRTATTVRPITTRYLRPSLTPFDAPPTREARYPALLHFTDGGDVQITDLTLDFPWAMKVLPWNGNMWSTLLAAILVDGGADQFARLHLARVGVLAAERTTLPTLTSNLLSAVSFGAKRALLPNGDSRALPDRLGSGTFFARHMYIRTAGVGLAIHDASDLDVRIFDNDIVDTRKNAISFFELGGSQASVSGNRIAARGTIINSYRGFRSTSLFPQPQPPTPTEPSTYWIASNAITLSAPGSFGADAIVTVDWLSRDREDIPNAGIDRWTLRANSIFLPIFGRGITVSGDRGRALVAENVIRGGPEAQNGIALHESTGTRTNLNVFPTWPVDRQHVTIGSTSGFCTVIEPANIVLDQGVNDIVVAREVRRTP
jgi:hypothetical protein